MLGKVVPVPVKRWLRRRFAAWLRHEMVHGVARAELETAVEERLPGWRGYFPHQPGAAFTVQLRTPAADERDAETGLPVPPRELWAGYGKNVTEYLHGKHDVAVMRDITARGGKPLEECGHVLELGCSAGRMLRWLHDLAGRVEVWGVDITADHIRWCRQHLSPPFHFAVTTTHPHLPFEDRFFGFVFAGSVFTHIDDLAEAWFQELRRVTRPGGRLYVTIHDRHTMEMLPLLPEYPLARTVAACPGYAACREADFSLFALRGRDWSRLLVFHDADDLCQRLRPYFRTLSVTPGAYGYQTAVLLERI